MKPKKKPIQLSTPLPSKEECYRHMGSRLFWERLSSRHDLPIDYLREFKDKLDWRIISGSEGLVLDSNLLEEFSDLLDWFYISSYKGLEAEDLDRFKHKLDWNRVTRNQKLSEDLFIKYADRLAWNFVYNQKLTMKLIKQYWNKLEPEATADWCQLDEDFIEEHWKEFKPVINMICRRQKLTAKFIWKHIDVLDIGAMAENGKIAPYLREKFKKCVKNNYVPKWSDRWYKYLYNNCNDLFVKFHNLRNPDIKEILGLM